jgi:hypothetical protein
VLPSPSTIGCYEVRYGDTLGERLVDGLARARQDAGVVGDLPITHTPLVSGMPARFRLEHGAAIANVFGRGPGQPVVVLDTSASVRQGHYAWYLSADTLIVERGYFMVHNTLRLQQRGDSVFGSLEHQSDVEPPPPPFLARGRRQRCQ